MKYAKPVVVAVAAVKAIQGTDGANKPISNFPDEWRPGEFPTVGAYEADE